MSINENCLCVLVVTKTANVSACLVLVLVSDSLVLNISADCASFWDRPKRSMSFLTQSHPVFSHYFTVGLQLAAGNFITSRDESNHLDW